jgi:cellulose synthase/poly-beta-1,6-N-acetylglucosamine synthase-like glycosyltransferase
MNTPTTHRVAAAAPQQLLDRHWRLLVVLLLAAYGAALVAQLFAGSSSQGLQTPTDWALMGLLHLPYLLILTLLAFGLTERIGYFWRGRVPPQPGRLPASLPKVCIQLPMFNERAVAERVILAAAAVRWPRDRLIVQVLDDSTEAATRAWVQAVCARVRDEYGVDCVWVYRPQRTGYKAGALEHGRLDTDAEFLAIFDADFVPPPEYLEQAIPHFFDAQARPVADMAVVQAQWGHLNDDESALTAAQALWVDDHHSLQMSWRSANIGFVNFTGTAGVWRASAIESAGGWRSASLVEDCELSVRALLAGWRTCFIRQLAVPAELPQTLAAYRLQQKRWTQGWAQLQRLHLANLLVRYATGAGRKAVLTYIVCISWQWPLWLLWIACLPFLMANGLWMGSFGVVAAITAYLLPPLLFALFAGIVACAETRHGRGSHRGSLARRCARIVPFLVINTGMVPHHFCAFVEGLFGPMHAEFERTPKTASISGAAALTAASDAAAPAPTKPRRKPGRGVYLGVEAAFVTTQAVWLVFFIQQGMGFAVLGSAWVLGCIVTLRLASGLATLHAPRP